MHYARQDQAARGSGSDGTQALTPFCVNKPFFDSGPRCKALQATRAVFGCFVCREQAQAPVPASASTAGVPAVSAPPAQGENFTKLFPRNFRPTHRAYATTGMYSAAVIACPTPRGVEHASRVREGQMQVAVGGSGCSCSARRPSSASRQPPVGYTLPPTMPAGCFLGHALVQLQQQLVHFVAALRNTQPLLGTLLHLTAVDV